ncbi:hypothetical protein NC653_005250 [Populus alba x Populus x berolinensis]|uniref:Uncharacterized protein n=1 Tax=Populus alba x Populus x berolinensis TaxID=444605 RepID=A0AAD6WB72_9ROSI|nr:hypothetical protein NC653_005250 [Populus alba x Populus x berolinensis]
MVLIINLLVDSHHEGLDNATLTRGVVGYLREFDKLLESTPAVVSSGKQRTLNLAWQDGENGPNGRATQLSQLAGWSIEN